MTLPPPPGAPFPDLWGRRVDPRGDVNDTWAHSVDERLFEERTVRVCGFVDDQAANRAAMALMTLDASGDEAVQLYVDSTGGDLSASFALIDVVDALGVEVHTLCMGQAKGPPVGILCVGDHRQAMEHARIQLCEPRLEVHGGPREIEAVSAAQLQLLQRLHERIAEATGQSPQTIERDMRRGRYLDASDAMSYGIVDEIVRPQAKILEFPRRLGFRRR